jgi:hypothetical protein
MACAPVAPSGVSAADGGRESRYESAGWRSDGASCSVAHVARSTGSSASLTAHTLQRATRAVRDGTNGGTTRDGDDRPPAAVVHAGGS